MADGMLALLLLLTLGAPEALPRGQIVPNVVCAADAEESYAAYLPSGYDPAKPAPILYLLDARRRGAAAAERFREAAEKYGWILGSSNNSESDGPFAPNIRAMRAMWEDTHGRFSIDPRRVYATGFSGGARAACLLARTAAKDQIAGVIGCGAGFPDNSPPARNLPFVYFGTVGNRDFNYREMRRLDATLASLGATHRLAVFDGPHDWPPSALAARAVEWMELEAMKRGARPRDATLVSEWLERGLGEAAVLENAGGKGAALERYREIGADFDGMTDVSAVRAALDRLERDREARLELERQARLEQREDAQLDETLRKLQADLASEDPIPPQRVAQDLRLPALRRSAESASTEAERLSAKRILAALFVQTSFYLPRDYLRRRDVRRANLCESLAAEVAPERAALVLYNYACLQAQTGDKKGALATLRAAIEKGFRNLAVIEKDPDLEGLRGEDGYRRIVEELKAAPSPAS
ncbi:MAG: TPR end-of-group domain-containing protein [Acidobacteriota bacterium]